MPFNDKFIIADNLIPKPSKRRSGQMISKVRFLVAHDTGNKNSTAAQNVHYYINSRNDMSASAHLFVDDKEIIECVPALTAAPEKAWHVLYGVVKDNELYGVNANDAAIGVEYCYGDNIDPDKAYQKYVWVLAKLCFVFGLDASKDITGHFFLDPKRKTDPLTGLAYSRRTYDKLLQDVAREYNECTGIAAEPELTIIPQEGIVTTTVKLNVRSKPNTKSGIVQVLPARTIVNCSGIVSNGERINNNTVWYADTNGHFLWSGGISTNVATIPVATSVTTSVSTPAAATSVRKAAIPALTSLPPDLPLSRSQCITTANWMETHFGNKCEAVVNDTPFTKELLYAIACQETACYFVKWINDHTPSEVLGRCVFDASGDVNGTRSAFPKNTAAFIAKYGHQVADMLIAEANKTRALRGWGPKQWVYCGYGIFQYDLQYIETDEDFFVKKQWYDIDDCLAKVIKELNSKWKAHLNDLFHTVKAYNGSGAKAENYANNVFQFLAWIRSRA